MPAEFTKNLMSWNALENRRQMPWKGESDPYRIWLSETILQQTRVEQGLAYYYRFIAAFPTIRALAAAPDTKVFKLWEGLGYYSRCKNLIETARVVTDKYDGVFPSDYATILSLKGVGPYTAAAIASFAFNDCRAVVDGNVQRVIARYYGISTPVDTSSGKALYAELAQAMIDPVSPGVYNQAIMDFGATICKPKNPLCESCVQKADCEAFKHSMVSQLPVKEKSIAKKSRWFYYYILRFNHQVYIRKRGPGDIWENLHEFVLFEMNGPDESPANEHLAGLFNGSDYRITRTSALLAQQLTHQRIHGRFVEVQLNSPANLDREYQLVGEQQLASLAFPRLINTYLSSEHGPRIS
jgi:A/G-specific adenine glycosylase